MAPAVCQTAGGRYQGAGSACSSHLCSGTAGACCGGGGSCLNLNLRDCQSISGRFAGSGSVCGPSACADPLGACCYPNSACAVTTHAECATIGASFRGVGTTCLVQDCGTSLIGPCCFLPGRCELMARGTCVENGGFFAGTNQSCLAAACEASPGACCFGLTCHFLPVADCALMLGQFRGPASLCSSTICAASCPCDWNGDGALDLNDLVNWSDQAQSGDGRAGDFNGDGVFNEDDARAFVGCFLRPPDACR